MNEAAKIHTGGIYDFMAPNLPPGMTRQAAAAWIREDPQAADKVFRDLMSASTDTRRAAQNGMFTFACPFPGRLVPRRAGLHPGRRLLADPLPGAGHRHRGRAAFKGQARTLYDAHLPQGIPDVHHRGRR
jgi:hypothetical protein